MTLTQEPGAVVMAVYRPAPALFEEQVSSLRAQTVTHWRCLVGIDGRDDATDNLVQRLVAGDPRFEVHHFPDNVGVYRNFERLLALVPHDVGWLSLADQDDRWYPDKFERLLPVLDTPGVSAVLGTARVVSDDGEDRGLTTRRPGDFVSTFFLNHLTGSLAMLRSEVLEQAFPFPAHSAYAIHDHWLAVLAAARGRIVQSPEVVQDYVQHSGNVIGEMKARTVADVTREIVRARGLARYVDDYAVGPWVWRVDMARGLDPAAVPAEAAAVIRAVRRGSLSWQVVSAVTSHVVRRRLTAVQGVAMLLAAARWRRTAPIRSA
jgi:glycosyltransferase involved in cell wall biosynthesis